MNKRAVPQVVNVLFSMADEAENDSFRVNLRKAMFARDVLPIVRARATEWFVNRDHADLVFRRKVNVLAVGSVAKSAQTILTANEEADHQPTPRASL